MKKKKKLPLIGRVLDFLPSFLTHTLLSRPMSWLSREVQTLAVQKRGPLVASSPCCCSVGVENEDMCALFLFSFSMRRYNVFFLFIFLTHSFSKKTLPTSCLHVFLCRWHFIFFSTMYKAFNCFSSTCHKNGYGLL